MSLVLHFIKVAVVVGSFLLATAALMYMTYQLDGYETFKPRRRHDR